MNPIPPFETLGHNTHTHRTHISIHTRNSKVGLDWIECQNNTPKLTHPHTVGEHHFASYNVSTSALEHTLPQVNFTTTLEFFTPPDP
jgi:hypothetical protein